MQPIASPDTLSPGGLSAPEPPFQVGSVDDAEHQDHVVCLDDVAHHAVVADTQPIEGVVGAADGLDRLAGEAFRAGHVTRKALECAADAITVCITELLESSKRRPREPDLVGSQSMSSSLTVRPFA